MNRISELNFQTAKNYKQPPQDICDPGFEHKFSPSLNKIDYLNQFSCSLPLNYYNICNLHFLIVNRVRIAYEIAYFLFLLIQFNANLGTNPIHTLFSNEIIPYSFCNFFGFVIKNTKRGLRVNKYLHFCNFSL